MNSSNQEKIPVRLKGKGNTLCVTLNPLESSEYLKAELNRLFKELNDPSKNANVTIDTGSANGHEELVLELAKYLKDNFGVASVSKPVKPQNKRSSINEEQIRKRDMERSWHDYQTDVLVLTGRVRSGQKVTARNHLVIMGDVNPGAEVLAGGDIIILGGLLGTAIAGQPENENSIVLALDFRPTQIQIGSYVAAGLPSSPGKITEFAHVENGNIIVENYLEANPFGRIPWPQAR
ncbi:putative septum site-determining protein [Desulfonema limicola]|uniref:Probable septum site-determining protein MinC n=1 Tax=Desulfonema limicola TaxID=45656 RepID=A0A975BBH3_9BACT|nr:septum site-determining protein MinC [Desulfonema limicola]QTA82247.1 putative septum site-determining protein [Desulfonema limicola]